MGKDLNWSEFVSGRGIRGWRKHKLHWLSAPIDTLLIRFEDIKADTEGQLANVMNWLGFEISDEKIRIAVEQCTIDKLRRKSTHGGNKFFRKGQIGKGIENFTAAQKSLVIENLAPLLERFGYDGVL
jgi:hypothetical protein